MLDTGPSMRPQGTNRMGGRTMPPAGGIMNPNPIGAGPTRMPPIDTGPTTGPISLPGGPLGPGMPNPGGISMPTPSSGPGMPNPGGGPISLPMSPGMGPGPMMAPPSPSTGGLEPIPSSGITGPGTMNNSTGPINTGPTNINPYMSRGGFTGATMPSPQYSAPAVTNIPDQSQGPSGGTFRGPFMNLRGNSGYAGSGTGLSNRPFGSRLFY